MGNSGFDRWVTQSFALQITSGFPETEERTTSFWEGHVNSEWFSVLGLKEGEGRRGGSPWKEVRSWSFPFSGRILSIWESHLPKLLGWSRKYRDRSVPVELGGWFPLVHGHHPLGFHASGLGAGHLCRRWRPLGKEGG